MCFSVGEVFCGAFLQRMRWFGREVVCHAPSSLMREREDFGEMRETGKLGFLFFIFGWDCMAHCEPFDGVWK